MKSRIMHRSGTNLEPLESDLLEIMVHMFSAYALEVLSLNSFHYYNADEELSVSVRGRIDFGNYVDRYARGNKHILPCAFNSFQFDNQFNRIVKYVASLLKNFTNSKSTRRNLEDVLFILDEVEFTPVNITDCDKVSLNPLYPELKSLLDSCRLFLSSLSVFRWKDEYDFFALLIPSEKLFENFIFNQIRGIPLTDVEEVIRSSSAGRTFLVRQMPDRSEKFRMINDIIIRFKDKSSIIIDAKYKHLSAKAEGDSNDEETVSSYKVHQSDIYQMISYAVGSRVSDIGLVYPNYIDEDEINELHFEVDDVLAGERTIRIYPYNVSIIHTDGLNLNLNNRIQVLFEESELNLKEQLRSFILRIRKDIIDSIETAKYLYP